MCIRDRYEPDVTVTAIVDGYNEEKIVAEIKKDRTRRYQHGRADFNVLTDDPDEEKRQDYSISSIDNFVSDSFEDLPEGEITSIPPTSPPILGPMQETSERMLIRSFGRYCALRIENNEGACEVTSVGVESTRSMNVTRTAA